MAIFKKKLPEEALADTIISYLIFGELKNNPSKNFNEEYDDVVISKFVKAYLYSTIVCLVVNYPDKQIALSCLIEKMFYEFLTSKYDSFGSFKLEFKTEFPEFEQFIQSGEKSGNTIFYGASQWVLNNTNYKSNLICLLEISNVLASNYVALEGMLEGVKSKFKFEN